MWGIIPAAGLGSRMQPIACSKELLPVGSTLENGVERPRAVIEYLVDRMLAAGATRLCVVIAPGKADIVDYLGGSAGGAEICYVVQPRPAGLCDAVFRACPLVQPEDRVVVGLPDTVWFPEDGLRRLPEAGLSFLLFPVSRPELFDAVITGEHGEVRAVQAKQPGAGSRWVWGAFAMEGAVMRVLQELFRERGEVDEYLGGLVNAYLARGGQAVGVKAGEVYVDVGTVHGWREAIRLLGGEEGA